MREAEQHGSARDRAINAAPSEGWSWLLTHGLVARNSSQSAADSVQESTWRQDALKNGIERLAAGERLGMSLHPRLAQRVQRQFLLGEFELAVFAAMKDAEVLVRQLSKASDSLLGTKLIQHAFAPSGPGPLADSEADPGEQVAAMELFKGVIGLFMNPASHKPVHYDDRIIASEIVLFTDLLLRLLDQVESRLNSAPLS